MHRRNLFFDYIVILFMVLWSGGFVTFGTFGAWPYFLLPIALFLFVKRGGRLTMLDYLFLIVSFFVLFIQRSIYGGTFFIALYPFLTLFDCYLLGKVLLKEFPRIFINIMYFFAIASLIIWTLDLFEPIHNMFLSLAKSFPQSPEIEFFWDEFGGNDYEYSIYLYNVKDRAFDVGLTRNCGPFFEPGRYAIFLGIAFMVNYFNNGRQLLERRSFVFLLTIITTFSTTGYVAIMFFLLASTFMNTKSHFEFRIFLVALMVVLGIYVMNLSFMGEKINENFLAASDDTQSRFGAFLYHMNLIGRSPFVGYGSHFEKIDLLKSPNGVSLLVLFWGIPIAIIMYILLYRNYKNLFRNMKSVFFFIPFVTTLLLAFSQTITTSPFFYFLYGIGAAVIPPIKSIPYKHNFK